MGFKRFWLQVDELATALAQLNSDLFFSAFPGKVPGWRAADDEFDRDLLAAFHCRLLGNPSDPDINRPVRCPAYGNNGGDLYSTGAASVHPRSL